MSNPNVAGTVRRSPAPSYAHAISSGEVGEEFWVVFDFYGELPDDFVSLETILSWPIVYTPEEDWR